MNKPIRLAVCLLTAGFAMQSPALAANDSAIELARQLNQAFVDVAEQASSSVVVISVTHKLDPFWFTSDSNPILEYMPKDWRDKLKERDRQKAFKHPPIVTHGSGVIVRDDGYIVTNSHVVEGGEAIKVRFKNGDEFDATIRGVDSQSDIAVVKIEAKGLKAAKLADSDQTKVGEFAIAIGAPFDLDYSVTFGHVSAKGRSQIIPSNAGGAAMDQDFIQTDASINPGNSGGPLVNINGEVIGINTLIQGMNTGIGFAVPSNLTKEVADQIIGTGKFTRSWLGIAIATLSQDKEFRELIGKGVKEGVIVREIPPDGPAAKSDLRASDVITAIDGKKVATSQELKNQIRSKKVGQELVLDVVRDGKPIQVKVKTAEWPEEKAKAAKKSAPSEPSVEESLGMKVQALTPDLAEKLELEKTEGVLVSEVAEGGPAAAQGIKPGDIVTDINRKPVKSLKAFKDAMKSADLKKGILLNIVSERAAKFVILKNAEK
jgi:serine protease Do